MKSGTGLAKWEQDEVAAFKRRCEARLQAAFAVLGVAPG
jgi:3-hydroxybutyryl-CoA dehydrogenase